MFRSNKIVGVYQEDSTEVSPPYVLSLNGTKFYSFPPVFHEWFIEMFPEPGAWFAARLKYTRSCAVMSMVGMVLG
jgi:phosphatidylinositol kinase/protein kinase (PI-3  family)